MRITFAKPAAALAIAAIAAGFAAPAQAHVGHLSEVAGHGHWLGAAAIGAAIAIGLWQGLKGKSDAQDDQDGAEASDLTDEEPQEA
ncbi:DUF6732 family protein [Pseudooceanicola nitratireducens]|uniref:DUF6732 family protein n=1 Tax=Pseudooceanicola nitratireducens TaxID=517719 RepID=UPI001C98C882|nr:DUF6732 family protein [Pseudooceanicola nitratireducens]MBY6157839.1 hypothetical protein [Pseudooceanicola nitratireducens]